MDKTFTAVAFCTQNQPYPDLLSNLVKSLETFGIKYETRLYPDTGDWCANTHLKALFLRDVLISHEGERVLYVDADAVIRRFPHLVATIPEEFAASIRVSKNGSVRELLSGTLIFDCNLRVLKLFDRWIELNFFNAHVGDQVNLQAALQDTTISFVELPTEYTFIFDITRREFPRLEPVIEHFQASRLARAARMNQITRSRI